MSRTVVWTAGIINNSFFVEHDGVFTPGRFGRAVVDQHLVAAEPDIYCIGDSADTPISGLAQTALHDADFLAANLIAQNKGRKLANYQPKQPIYAVPAGPGWSAVKWRKIKVYGRFGWLVRRLADLRLYLKFWPLRKALVTWRYGTVHEEICPVCEKK